MKDSGSPLQTAGSSVTSENARRPVVTFCSYDKPDSVGGPFSWLRRLVPSLIERGLDCRCLFLTHYGGTGPIIEGLRTDGVDCRVVDCHDRTVDQVRWVLEQLQENPPDVFVPNLVVAAYHAARWVRSAGIPTVGVLHSDDAYYRAIQDEFVFGAKKQRLSSVICVSRELENQVCCRKPAQTTVCRIPYGVPVPSISVTPDPSRFRIAYVGRLAEEQKRISEVTRAFIRVCRTIPGAEAVIYGDGPDRHNVEKILADEGQDVSVKLAGNIPNNQIQKELLQCDVIALLSDFEGLPIALLEAMACGCVPICLSMRSGIPELIHDGVEGLIVSDREDSFLRAVGRVQSDVELRKQLSLAARQKIISEYSDPSSADTWAGHLRSMNEQKVEGEIRVPRTIRLSRRNPAIESANQRQKSPSTFISFLRRSRMLAGRLRRRLL